MMLSLFSYTAPVCGKPDAPCIAFVCGSWLARVPLGCGVPPRFGAGVVRVLVAEPEGVTELVRDHDLRRSAVRDQIDAPVVGRVPGRAGRGLDVLDHPRRDVREPARGELRLDVVGPLLRERLVVLVGARPRGVRFDGDVRRPRALGAGSGAVEPRRELVDGRDRGLRRAQPSRCRRRRCP